MKRKLSCAIFLVGALFFLGVKSVSAAPKESDLRSKTVVHHSTWSVGVNVSTNVILVSANSVQWPNPTAEINPFINITNLYVVTDKVTASSCTVKIGVVTAVDASSGSVKYFFEMPSNRNVSNSLNNVFFESDNSFRCLRVNPPVYGTSSDGITPFLMSNSLLQGSTAFKTTLNLPAVNVAGGGMSGTTGGITPQVGDIVMSVVNNDFTTAIGVYVDILYHLDSR